MIKDGKPYSIENGHIDDELISTSNLTNEEEFLVHKWIHDNIKPSKRILKYNTSYGLKHLLESDTGIYLTNNAFKDAMMIEGYKPVDPNELNWEYRITLKMDRKNYKLDKTNLKNSIINQSNVNSDQSNVNITHDSIDDITQEFMDMFNKLNLENKIKVMNYTSRLKNKQQ